MQFTTAGDADCFKGFKNHRKLTAIFREVTANFLQAKEKPINQEQTFDEYAKTRYEEVAKRILNGDFGNGQERKVKLINAGYDYKLAQKMVKEIL